MFKKILLYCILLGAAPSAWAASPGDFVWWVKTSSPVVALTFDDGPGPDTPKVLEVLKAHNAKATFFMLGEAAKWRPQMAARIVQEGHEPASHLYSHTSFAKIPPETGRAQLAESMTKSRQVIEKATSQKLIFCRMPHGVDKPWIRQVAKEQGFALVNWTFGYDWLNLDREQMAKAYVEKIRPGAIILMHDGGKRQKTVDVLKVLLQALEKKGFRIVTVGQLLSEFPPSPVHAKAAPLEPPKP